MKFHWISYQIYNSVAKNIWRIFLVCRSTYTLFCKEPTEKPKETSNLKQERIFNKKVVYKKVVLSCPKCLESSVLDFWDLRKFFVSMYVKLDLSVYRMSCTWCWLNSNNLSSDMQRHLMLGKGSVLTNWPSIITRLLLKKTQKVLVVNPLPAWLTFDQIACKFENIGGAWRPSLPLIGTSLSLSFAIYYVSSSFQVYMELLLFSLMYMWKKLELKNFC